MTARSPADWPARLHAAQHAVTDRPRPDTATGAGTGTGYPQPGGVVHRSPPTPSATTVATGGSTT